MKTINNILMQCMAMSTNKRIDAFFEFHAHINQVSIRVNIDTDYIQGNKHNELYVKYIDFNDTKTSLIDMVYNDLREIEKEFKKREVAA